MEESLKKYKKSIRKVHRFGWPPSYEKSCNTSLSAVLFIPIVLEVFSQLKWHVTYFDENSAHAIKKTWGMSSEKIIVQYHQGGIVVKSNSTGNEFWDNGRNSKRVKLFIHALGEKEKNLDSREIKGLEETIEQERNWEIYQVPPSLTPPKKQNRMGIWLPILGAFCLSIALGFLLSVISLRGAYIIFFLEVLVALALTLGFKLLLKLSNYHHYQAWSYIIIGSTLTIFLSHHFFLFKAITSLNHIESMGFGEFFLQRINLGLNLKEINLGPIGMILSWIVELGVIWAFSYVRMTYILTYFVLNRVPEEVRDFAYYLFYQGKSEDEVRNELATKGWDNFEDQNEVFEAISAWHDAWELAKGE